MSDTRTLNRPDATATITPRATSIAYSVLIGLTALAVILQGSVGRHLPRTRRQT